MAHGQSRARRGLPRLVTQVHVQVSAALFKSACEALDLALRGSLRRDVMEAAARHGTMRKACAAPRDRMRAHSWHGGGHALELKSLIEALDLATRAEGFHVLHDWNGKAEAV